MRKFKSIYAILIPVTVLSLASCNKGKQTLSFLNALEYAQNHYDEHIYDDVKGTYTLSLDNLNANLNIKAYNEYGLAYEGAVGGGFKDIQLGMGGLPALCLSSKFLNAMNVAYTKYAAISMEFVTNIGIGFGYTVENGCMSIRVGTNTNDGLLNILKCGFPILNGYLAYAGIVEEYIKSGSKFGALMAMGLGMAPNSTGNGDLSFTVTTDNEGFVTGLKFNMSATDLDLHMATGILPVLPGYKDLSYTLDVSGDLQFGFSLTAAF